MIQGRPRAVVVVGGGAAGLFAAGRAAETGAKVFLLEKTDQLGKKIRLSGKGRCNLSNTKPLDEFIRMYGPNGKFLYGAFHRFFRDDLVNILARYGLKTKTERGGRIFPATDNAGDVVSVCQRYLRRFGVKIRLNCRVQNIVVEGGRVRGLDTQDGFYPAGAVVLTTGGASYPGTGSTGDGYRLAAQLGHTIVPLRPALVPLVVKEIALARSMQGVALKNVRLTSFGCKAEEIDDLLTPKVDVGRALKGRARRPVIESRFGEMMITHFGLGGPIVLLMSLAVVDALKKGDVSVSLDLKPALTHAQLEERIQRDLNDFGRRGFQRILGGLLPRKLIAPIAALADIPLDKPAHQITKEEKGRLARLLKAVKFNIKAPLPLEQAIVTAGGVSLDEVDPRTMASRLVKGLYLAGEVLDLDADTGGFNLQAAFSTGWLAGQMAAELVLDEAEG